ncbi:MAG: diadenylate cyclase CdaA [Bacteroidia bacterium]|nr:diadenylate cyclase CdaA [Bacteroidia bacterium]
MPEFSIGFVTVTALDVLDILLVSFLFYKLYKAFRSTVVVQVVVLLLVVFLVYRVVEVLKMDLLLTLLNQFLSLGSIALVVVFSPEIRRFFLGFSQNTVVANLRRRLAGNYISREVEYQEIIEACDTLSSARTGAIVVLERATALAHIEQTGDRIGAVVSKRLLLSIFNRTSPLHDGAVLIRGDQIVAARCVLPISDDPDLPPELGMRHRAALGITEVSDAAAVIVSEETGKVSVAVGGRLKRNLSGEELLNFFHTLEDREFALV